MLWYKKHLYNFKGANTEIVVFRRYYKDILQTEILIYLLSIRSVGSGVSNSHFGIVRNNKNNDDYNSLLVLEFRDRNIIKANLDYYFILSLVLLRFQINNNTKKENYNLPYFV